MSKKTLKMNRFGESILAEYELYSYKFEGMPERAYPQNNEKSNIMLIKFSWSWNGYSGTGKIFYDNDSFMLCNQDGENFSCLDVSPDSRRKQLNERNNCSLYNDPSMAKLFSDMLIKLSQLGYTLLSPS